MPIYQVVILAVVQSLTEFLPISSTAHLALVPWLFGWRDPGLTFDIALHFGTLAALLAYFFRDWLQLAAQGLGIRIKVRDPELARNPKLLWMLALATVPVGIVGFLFEEYAETTWRSPFIIGTMLIVVGLLILIAERISTAKKDLSKVTLLDSILIGLSQAVALIPGTSRSGITITTGLLRNLNRASAARFSFLLSTPALFGASLKAALDLHGNGGIEPAMVVPFIIGVVVSAITGWIVISWFLRYLRIHTLRLFVYYRVAFGIMILALAFASRN